MMVFPIVGGFLLALALGLHRLVRGFTLMENLPHVLLDTLLFGVLMFALFFFLPEALRAPLRPLPAPTALDGIVRPDPRTRRIGEPLRSRDLSGNAIVLCFVVALIIGLGWTRVWLVENALSEASEVLRQGDPRRIATHFMHEALSPHGLFDTGADFRELLLPGASFSARRQQTLALRKEVVTALEQAQASPYALWNDYPLARIKVRELGGGRTEASFTGPTVSALMANPKTVSDFERRLLFKHEPLTVVFERYSDGTWRVAELPQHISLARVEQ